MLNEPPHAPAGRLFFFLFSKDLISFTENKSITYGFAIHRPFICSEQLTYIINGLDIFPAFLFQFC